MRALFLILPVVVPAVSLACSRPPGVRADDAQALDGDPPNPPNPPSTASAAGPVIVGRSDGRRFAWSGTTIRARFTGPSIALRIRVEPPGETTPYSVHVDDRPPSVIEVARGEQRIELAAGLDPAAPHTVRVVREAEAFAGVHELLGLDLGAGGRFLEDKPPALRIEIIGDSITCGYGVLGDDGRCRFSFATERSTAAYGALTAVALGADLTTIAWSGKGAYRNYDGTTTDTMPVLFELAIPEDRAPAWIFAQHPPADAVVIALGTNDFLGGKGQPLDAQAFEDAYVKLTRRVRDVYPKAFVFVTTPPMLSGAIADAAKSRLEHVVARRTGGEGGERDSRIELVPFPNEAPHWGCDHHPDVAMNHAMADRLISAIQKRLAR